MSQDGFTAALNGVMAHEFGHQLGFFDLYNVFSGLPVVGSFSLMDSGESMYGTVGDPYDSTQAVAVRGILPASIDPWHRIVFPFFRLNVHEGHDGDLVELPGVLEQNDLLYVPIHLAEYYLAETRPYSYEADSLWALRADPETGVVLGPESATGDSTDVLSRLNYDYLLPGAGMLFWHIDELAASTGLSSPYGSINIFDDRRGVDVEEADGIQDIGTASSEFTGGPYDPYFLGGYSEFGPETVPSTSTNDGSRTGLAFSVLDTVGVSMRVRMGQPREIQGFPLGFAAAPAGVCPLNHADLDGDGSDELLIAAGPTLFAITPDGKGFADEGDRVVFASFPGTLEEGPAIADGLERPRSRRGPGVVVRRQRQPHERLARRPRHGARDGRADRCAERGHGRRMQRRIDARSGPATGRGARVAWTLDAGGGTDSVTVVAAGRAGSDDAISLAAGTAGGRVLRGGLSPGTGEPYVTRGWPIAIGEGRVRDLLLLAGAAAVRGEDPQDLLLAVSEGRRIDLRSISGVSVPGWPHELPDTPRVLRPIGDLDGDGVLEVAATTRAGDLCLWDSPGRSSRTGPALSGIPTRPTGRICTTGPRFWDLGEDGVIELVPAAGRRDDRRHRRRRARRRRVAVCDRVAFSADGPDAPASHRMAMSAGTRPMRSRTPSPHSRGWPSGGSRVPRGTISPAASPGPRGGPARNGVYLASLVPTPKAAQVFFDPAALILHPNPVRGDELKVRYVLGSPASIELEAIDLSGRIVSRTAWEGNAGAAGETKAWDVKNLAPGVYVIRMSIRGDAEEKTLMRKIAVVR